MIVETTNKKNSDRMTASPVKYHNIPSDVTVESTAPDPKGISEDLLDAVGKTEKSFEDELEKIRRSMYNIPAKYSTGSRSNLFKQLNPKIPEESDSLLGTLTSPISYLGPNDNLSIRTDDQSHSSQISFGSNKLSIPLGTLLQTVKVEEESAEGEELFDTQAKALPQHDVSTDLESQGSFLIEYSGCESLMMEIHKNLKMHRLAADYFKFRNFVFFQVPQALFAIASTVLAFMGAAGVLEATLQTWVVTLAGCCSALVVLLQTLSSHCEYGKRASMHDGTTIYLRDLDDDLTMLMSKLRKTEMTEKTDDESKSQSQQQQQRNSEINEDTYVSLQSRYRHSLKGCKSDVPTRITEAFAEIDSFILLSRTAINRKYLVECGMFESQKFQGITLKSYDRLASNMVGSFLWPLNLPCPKKLVKMTIAETRSDLHQMKSFWETPPPKEDSIRCLPYKKTRRTMPKFAAL